MGLDDRLSISIWTVTRVPGDTRLSDRRRRTVKRCRLERTNNAAMTGRAARPSPITSRPGEPMILATSHISKPETFALVKAAKERRVERIIITHVDFPSTFYTVEEQKELLKSGAFMEHCYTTPATGKVGWDVAVEQIRAIGPDRVVLTTDLGQATAVYPDEGLALFGEKLLAEGFSEADVRTMIVKNPASLVE